MNIMKSSRAAANTMVIIFEVVIVVALIPVIVTFIAEAENLTTTESTLLSLVPLFLVLGLIYLVARQTSMAGGKK